MTTDQSKSDAGPKQNVRETPGEIARKLAVIELGVSDETFIGKIASAIRAALAQSDAEQVAWQVRPEVAAFALLMERKLRNNDHKPGWKENSPDALARRVVEEANELLDAASSYEASALSPIPKVAANKIGSEAADVANMAMMVADVCGALPALAQSDAEPREVWGKQPPGPDSILHELGECPTQSDAEPPPLRYSDKAERAGDGTETRRLELAQSDAGPAADARLIEAAEWLSTAASRFEEAADALRSEYKTYARQIDRRWAGVHGELIPDCPTEGVAARQGNGG